MGRLGGVLHDVDQGLQGSQIFRRRIRQDRIGRGHHDGAVGAAFTAIHQHGLGEQGDQRALAVPHDGDGFIGGHAANLADQHGQPGRREHEVTPVRRLAHVQGVGHGGLHPMAQPFGETLFVHLQQIVGGVSKKSATLGEMSVQTVVEPVLELIA
ncbi:hypothetical protein D3C84_618660 [compost metagenome]